MAKSRKRPLAVLVARTIRKIGEFILRARTIVLNIGNNAAIFTTPDPPLAGVTTHIDELEAAEATARTRVAGSAAARDLTYDAVLDDLNQLKAYVQNLADRSDDEALAVSIIEASGFDLKNKGVRVKPPLAVKNSVVPGEVILTAKAASNKRAFYDRQYSKDGVDWVDLPGTFQAKTKATGLIPGSAAYFRVRILLPEGPTAWSAIVGIAVSLD